MKDDLLLSALAGKYRYQTDKGSLTTEDLFSLSLKDLDTLAKSLNQEVQKSSVSFIASPSQTNKTLQLRFEVVLFVIKFKQEREEERKLQLASATEKAQKRDLLAQLIANKEMENLASKPLEELQRELNALGE